MPLLSQPHHQQKQQTTTKPFSGGLDSSTLRAESALELLRGSVVRAGGVVRFLATPADPTCRSFRLLCRRASEYDIPTVVALDEGGSATDSSATRKRAKEKSRYHRSRGGAENDTQKGSGRDAGDRGNRVGKGGGRGGAGGDKGVTRRETSGASTAAVAAGFLAGGGNMGVGDGGPERNEKLGWARRLREWGAVTTSSEIVVADRALEVWHHDCVAATVGKGGCARAGCTRVHDVAPG